MVDVATLPRAGETITGRGVTVTFGGKGANQACAAAAGSAAVSLVGAVGADAAGYASIEDLERHRVDTRHVRTVHAPTGVADVFVDDSGENFIVIQNGANGLLTAAMVSDALADLRIGTTDVLMTSCEVGDEALAASARAAAAHGSTHLHNIAPYREMGPWSRAENVVVVANEVEAQQATGRTDAAHAAADLGDGRRAAVVTRGARVGALLVIGSRSWEVPAPRVRAIDSTGAGDAFCGTLAAGIAAGLDVTAAVRSAVDAAALAVTHLGARRTDDGASGD